MIFENIVENSRRKEYEIFRYAKDDVGSVF